MSDVFRTAFRIDAGHPALAGHFPGNPVVPGVVLLERVAATLREWRGERIATLDVKFARPLSPGEEAVLELREDAARVRFAVNFRDGTTVTSGVLGTTPR